MVKISKADLDELTWQVEQAEAFSGEDCQVSVSTKILKKIINHFRYIELEEDDPFSFKF